MDHWRLQSLGFLESWNHVSRHKRHCKMFFSVFTIWCIPRLMKRLSLLTWRLLYYQILEWNDFTIKKHSFQRSKLYFSITLQLFTIYFEKKKKKLTWNWNCKWLEKLIIRYGSYLLLLYQAFVDHIFLLSYQNNPQQDSKGLVDRLQQKWQHADSLLKYPGTNQKNHHSNNSFEHLKYNSVFYFRTQAH